MKDKARWIERIITAEYNRPDNPLSWRISASLRIQEVY